MPLSERMDLKKQIFERRRASTFYRLKYRDCSWQFEIEDFTVIDF